MGRLLVFLARLNEPDGKPLPPPGPGLRGIGIEQGAAVLLDPDGKCKVVGKGAAYFVEPVQDAVLDPARQSTADARLISLTASILKVPSGHTFDLTKWQGEAIPYTLTVKDSAIRSTQPGGSVY